MTVAHPGADYCSLCWVEGSRTLAHVDWPGAPLCRAHIIACGGMVEDTVIDLSTARVRLRSPPPQP
jgi:hypothetical protein